MKYYLPFQVKGLSAEVERLSSVGENLEKKNAVLVNVIILVVTRPEDGLCFKLFTDNQLFSEVPYRELCYTLTVTHSVTAFYIV